MRHYYVYDKLILDPGGTYTVKAYRLSEDQNLVYNVWRKEKKRLLKEEMKRWKQEEKAKMGERGERGGSWGGVLRDVRGIVMGEGTRGKFPKKGVEHGHAHAGRHSHPPLEPRYEGLGTSLEPGGVESARRMSSADSIAETQSLDGSLIERLEGMWFGKTLRKKDSGSDEEHWSPLSR
jgi:hypothetical protein